MDRSVLKQTLSAIGLMAVIAGVMIAAAGVLAALPTLLLFVSLLAGRYVGLGWIERKVSGRAPALRRPAPFIASGFGSRLWAISGGKLIAFSLAERPPPASTLA